MSKWFYAICRNPINGLLQNIFHFVRILWLSSPLSLSSLRPAQNNRWFHWRTAQREWVDCTSAHMLYDGPCSCSSGRCGWAAEGGENETKAFHCIRLIAIGIAIVVYSFFSCPSLSPPCGVWTLIVDFCQLCSMTKTPLFNVDLNPLINLVAPDLLPYS